MAKGAGCVLVHAIHSFIAEISGVAGQPAAGPRNHFRGAGGAVHAVPVAARRPRRRARTCRILPIYRADVVPVERFGWQRKAATPSVAEPGSTLRSRSSAGLLPGLKRRGCAAASPVRAVAVGVGGTGVGVGAAVGVAATGVGVSGASPWPRRDRRYSRRARRRSQSLAHAATGCHQYASRPARSARIKRAMIPRLTCPSTVTRRKPDHRLWDRNGDCVDQTMAGPSAAISRTKVLGARERTHEMAPGQPVEARRSAGRDRGSRR